MRNKDKLKQRLRQRQNAMARERVWVSFSSTRAQILDLYDRICNLCLEQKRHEQFRQTQAARRKRRTRKVVSVLRCVVSCCVVLPCLALSCLAYLVLSLSSPVFCNRNQLINRYSPDEGHPLLGVPRCRQSDSF